MPNPHSQPEGASGRTEAAVRLWRDRFIALAAVGAAVAEAAAEGADDEAGCIQTRDEMIAMFTAQAAALEAEVAQKDAEIERLTAALAEAKKVMEIALLNLPDEPYVAEAILEANAIAPAGRQDG